MNGLPMHGITTNLSPRGMNDVSDYRGKNCICDFGIGHPNVKEHTATCNNYQAMSETIAQQQAEIERLNKQCDQAFHDLGVIARRAETFEAEIALLREAIAIERMYHSCPECGECLEGGLDHSEDCKYFSTNPQSDTPPTKEEAP